MALCSITKDESPSYGAITVLIDRLRELDNQLDSTPISDFIRVNNQTTAALVCDNNESLKGGAFSMLVGSGILLFAQVGLSHRLSRGPPQPRTARTTHTARTA